MMMMMMMSRLIRNTVTLLSTPHTFSQLQIIGGAVRVLLGRRPGCQLLLLPKSTAASRGFSQEAGNTSPIADDNVDTGTIDVDHLDLEQYLGLRIKAGRPLPESLQRAVDEQMKALLPVDSNEPPEINRHMVRNWKIDARKTIKKSKKRKLRRVGGDLPLSPVLLVGAFQRLQERAIAMEEAMTRNEMEDPHHTHASSIVLQLSRAARRNILTDDVTFAWCMTASRELLVYSYNHPKIKGGNRNVNGTMNSISATRTLIVHEALAMVMTRHMEQYLPPYALCLQHRQQWQQPCLQNNHPLTTMMMMMMQEGNKYNTDNNEDKHNQSQSTILRMLERRAIQAALEDQPVAEDRQITLWNLATADKRKSKKRQPNSSNDDDNSNSNTNEYYITLTDNQLKMIGNMIEPYFPAWWFMTIRRLFNTYSVGTGDRKTRTWSLSNDTMTSLPALLQDMLFLRLDHSELIRSRAHPFQGEKTQALRSTGPKNKMGLDPTALRGLRLPRTIDDACEDFGYVRYGPVVLLRYHGGPLPLLEKLEHRVENELKSMLQFPRHIVADGYARFAPSIKIQRQICLREKLVNNNNNNNNSHNGNSNTNDSNDDDDDDGSHPPKEMKTREYYNTRYEEDAMALAIFKAGTKRTRNRVRKQRQEDRWKIDQLREERRKKNRQEKQDDGDDSQDRPSRRSDRR